MTHFEFEDSLEDSVGDNNGIFTRSDSSIYNTGRNGKALVFNGTSDYMKFGKNFDPRYNGHYSISMWVLSQEQASSTNNNCYISRHTSSGGNAIRFGYFSNQLSFSVKNEVVYISAAGNEPTGGWVHYVISAREQDNGTTSVAIYKNGSQLWSGTLNDVAGTLNNGNNSWVLGANLDPANSEIDFFKGKMDDIRIYDWNITADEVREIYYKEAAAIHLRMDDSFNSSSAGYIPGNQAGGAFFKQGMENRSVYLDGINDYVQFGYGTTDPRSSGTKYTISMWIKSDAQATSSNNNAYIAKHDNNNGDVFRFGYWNNKLILKIGASSADISTSAEPTSWTHYAITATENSSTSTTSATVYRNGSQIWTGTISAVMGAFTSSYKPWLLGRKMGTSGDYLKGEIDNVRFYGSVLNAAAIQALYRSEFSGVRYCDTDQNSANCSVINNTVNDLSQYSWVSSGFPNFILVLHSSIESIKVSDGWEAYLCTQTNHQGSCRYYDDGFYNSSNLLDSSLINNVYSMTVQPSSFSAAKKFFGFRRADGSGNYPTGFAYIYEPMNFAKPTKAAGYRRLFLNSYDRYDFSTGLPNSIIRTNYVTSAELYGDVYLVVGNSTYGSKELMTSHYDFSTDMPSYTELDFRNYYHNVYSAVLHGKTEVVGSVGWYLASDFPASGTLFSLCRNGVSETLDLNSTRIECMKYLSQNLPFDDDVSDNPDEFFSKNYSGSNQEFERYTDNYSLLMLTGHGSYIPELAMTIPTFSISITKSNDDLETRQIIVQSIGTDPYSQNLGKLYTRWLETSACQSMGVDGVNWKEVGDVYYNILTRLNGVGGYRNDSLWILEFLGTNYENHWEDLTHNNKTVSKAWVDSWSSNDTPVSGRNARFLTLELCNCSQINCFTYMQSDFFYNVSTGPLAQKTDLTNYNYYCFRDRDDNFDGVQLNSSKSSLDYPEEFAAYSYDSLPNYIVEQLFGVKIDDNTAKFRGNDRYNYKDDYVILNRKDKNIQAVMNRKMTSFENEKESEDMIDDKFNEAKNMAETLTVIKLEYAGISRDYNEAFEVNGNGESLGKMINSVAFVFRPVTDGIPIFAESIEVEYDAEGFYQLRSNVPYSLSETKKGMIKSEDDVETEIYSALGKEEEKIIAYVLNEDGEFVLSAVAKDDAKETYLTISLEKSHD